MSIKIANNLGKKIKSFGERKKARIRGEIANTMTGIHRDAAEAAAVDTNVMRSGIQMAPAPDGLSGEVFVQPEYAVHVEYGTAPHMPPIDALRGWARRHGLAGKEWAIARKIARSGTKARPFFEPAVKKWSKGFMQRMNAAIRGK